jgi:glucose-6-phosphate-specific signal transduction histidine kinase
MRDQKLRGLQLARCGCQQAKIALERIESRATGTDELRLSLTDDGCGMQSSKRTSRFGLSGMRERVEMGGGTFVLDSAPGCGLRFEAHLPANRGIYG